MHSLKILLIIIVILITIIAFLSSKLWQNKKKCELSSKEVTELLYRQSARYAVASIQDKSELIALLHANYAAGYLWALKSLIKDKQFQQITGGDLLEFETKIVKTQDAATRRMIQKCPGLIFTKDDVLLKASYGMNPSQSFDS